MQRVFPFVARAPILFSFILFSFTPASCEDLIWDNGSFVPFGPAEMSRQAIANDFDIASVQTLGAVRFWSYEGIDIVGVQTFFGSIYWAVYTHDPATNQPGALIASGLTADVTRSVPPQNPAGFGAFFQYDFAIGPLTLMPGKYWLALHNGPLRHAKYSDMLWAMSGVRRGLGRRAGDIVQEEIRWLPSPAEAQDDAFQLYGFVPGDLIYSSYGPANTYCQTAGCRTWTIGSGLDTSGIGFVFAAPRSNPFTLDAVTLTLSATGAAAEQTGPGAGIAVSLNADENGIPGAPLETLFYSLAGMKLDQPVTITLISESHPRLEAGRRYWITAKAGMTPGLVLLWQSNPSGNVGAFSVRGTPQAGGGLPPLPVPISDRVAIAQSDWVGARDRSGQGWSTVLTVTNTGAANSRGERMSAIEGPIQIVLADLSPNARLLNATGLTPEGLPYITITRDPLLTGASVSAVLQFANSTGGAISFKAEAFLGIF